MTSLETATFTPNREPRSQAGAKPEGDRDARGGASSDAAASAKGKARRLTTRRARSGADDKPRRDLFEEVTAKIVRELEAGRFPWAQPWMSAKGAARGEGATIAGLPKNAATGADYSGINILLLWGAAIENGFSTQVWLTFKQALALGGNVMKGERGSMVVYADKFIPKDEQERVAKEGGEANFVPFLKRYSVFNVAQCEGLAEAVAKNGEPPPLCETNRRAENLIKATGADFRIGGDRAFYAPSQDFIRVPPQPAFFEPIDYYRTCFHELGHWTGHAARLNREFKGRYGSRAYAREELVALSGQSAPPTTLQ